MEQHLIFIDIDGTLIRNNHSVAPITKQVIEELQAAGHIVYIATGRMRLLAEGVRNKVNQDVKLINSNGAMYDLGDDVKKIHLGQPAIDKVLDIATTHDTPVRFFSDSKVVHNVGDGKELSIISFFARELPPNSITHFNDRAEITAIYPEIINGIIAGGQPGAVDNARAALEASPLLDVSSSAPGNIELLPKGISKASAVQAVQAFYSIDAAHTLVFGNGENDMPMMEVADISVAMANSPQEVIDHAKFVTNTNEDDGVAKYLIKYFDLKH
ncbi:HAD family hydrolase [Periweissella cryptocerci]|uniref:HAD family hydrolase n=1 Tax=Periweissella cryptocerci TaxID=2506420 RepID=A0A4P6YTQ9_9LACO|nr:HAD family hydrolase [Periweissella cryptocerci]QBO36081.1 HAD family hydrolase [Periweissella cryptocerci]